VSKVVKYDERLQACDGVLSVSLKTAKPDEQLHEQDEPLLSVHDERSPLVMVGDDRPGKLRRIACYRRRLVPGPDNRADPIVYQSHILDHEDLGITGTINARGYSLPNGPRTCAPGLASVTISP
jgi:hypothetical protein